MIEEWRDVVGYEGYYIVSNTGRVISLKRVVNMKNGSTKTVPRRELSQSRLTNSGYKLVQMRKEGRTENLLHRVVAITFIDNDRNYKVVNHIDGDKLNNNIDNLEWTSYKKNAEHAIDMGLDTRKLNKEKVLEIYKMSHDNLYNQTEIGNMFGVTPQSVSQIKIGKVYSRITGHINPKYPNNIANKEK